MAATVEVQVNEETIDGSQRRAEGSNTVSATVIKKLVKGDKIKVVVTPDTNDLTLTSLGNLHVRAIKVGPDS